MSSGSGKCALRAPTSLVMDGMDDHDMLGLSSRLKHLARMIVNAPAGEIRGDQAGRCWVFDLAEGSRVVLSVSPKLTTLNVSPRNGLRSYALSMDVQTDGAPTADGRAELRLAVKRWRSRLALPRRMMPSTVQGAPESHRRAARTVAALLSVHGDRSYLDVVGMPKLYVRPESIGIGPSIRDDLTGKDVVSAPMARHLLLGIGTEAGIRYDHDTSSYILSDAPKYPPVPTDRLDPVECMRVLADLPPDLHDPSCLAGRYLP